MTTKSLSDLEYEELTSGATATIGGVTIADGADVAQGATADTSAANTVVGRLKKLVSLLPTALGAQGGLVVEGAASGTPVPVTLQAGTTGGSTPYKNLDAQTTGSVVKNGAGQLFNYVITNRAASERFLKFYDKATAATSADTPVWTIPVPPNCILNVAFPNGIAFSTGIGIRASTGIADNDNTAPTANDVVVDLGYK